MSQKYYSIPTEIGLAAITNASIVGEKINITHFAVGDGNGNYYEPQSNAVSLKNETWRGNITNCEIDKLSKNIINISSIIPSNIGGFTIREMGVFDNKNQLIAIANTPETAKVAISEGVSSELEVTMQIILTHTDVVKVEVNPTVILATKADIKKLKAELLEELKKHCEDSNIHISKTEKQKWNKAAELSGENKKGLDDIEKKSSLDNTKIIEKVNSIPIYNANENYINGTYEIVLENAPSTLPNNYLVNFTAPTDVKKGDKVAVINPNKYFDNKYKGTLLNRQFTKSVDSICVSDDGYINLKTTVGNRNAEIKSSVKAKDILKPSTEYTLILDIKTKRDDCWLYVNMMSAKLPLFTEEIYTAKSGIVKLKLTTRSDVSNADLFHFRHTAVNDKVQYDCEFKAWLVEGDHTNRDIKITAKDELLLTNSYNVNSILTYGKDSPPVEDNSFVKGQPVQLQINNNGAFVEIINKENFMPKTGGEFTGPVVFNQPAIANFKNDLVGLPVLRNIVISPDDPSGGVSGDLWFKIN